MKMWISLVLLLVAVSAGNEGTWATGSWDDCSKFCGDGKQTRNVRCSTPEVPCSPSTKPDQEQTCNLQDCGQDGCASDEYMCEPLDQCIKDIHFCPNGFQAEAVADEESIAVEDSKLAILNDVEEESVAGWKHVAGCNGGTCSNGAYCGHWVQTVICNSCSRSFCQQRADWYNYPHYAYNHGTKYCIGCTNAQRSNTKLGPGWKSWGVYSNLPDTPVAAQYTLHSDGSYCRNRQCHNGQAGCQTATQSTSVQDCANWVKANNKCSDYFNFYTFAAHSKWCDCTPANDNTCTLRQWPYGIQAYRITNNAVAVEESIAVEQSVLRGTTSEYSVGEVKIDFDSYKVQGFFFLTGSFLGFVALKYYMNRKKSDVYVQLNESVEEI